MKYDQFTLGGSTVLVCREDDISDVMQEISALANCDCQSITKYHNSLLLPNSSKLLIAMELMACSGSDVVCLSSCKCANCPVFYMSACCSFW
jgi:hypothetical protein